MSQFKAKDLTYDKSEPAFLRRMKAGYASQDGRNNIQHARPSKSRLNMGDGDDDEPVILDESGDVVEKGVWEGMVRGEVKEVEQTEKAEEQNVSDRADGEATKVVGREGQKVAEVGAPAMKKRKAVKVVGADEDGEIGKEGASGRNLDLKGSQSMSDKKNDKKLAVDKSKKKTKKIKLSFDDPE